MPEEVIPAFKPPVRLDPYVTGPGFPALVDADALLSSIDNQCRTDRQSRLSRLGDSHIVPVFASEHVYLEVYRGFAKLARRLGVTVEQLRACFEEDYLPNIRWVRVGDGYGHDVRVRQVTDPTDVPTAHLASLIAPCMVYADDKSLRRPGFAPPKWREAAGSAVTVIDANTGQYAIVAGASLPVMGTVKGSLAVGKRLNVPGWGSLIILTVLVTWLLWSGERRRAIGRILTPVMDEFARLEDQQQLAIAELEPVIFTPMAPPTAKQMVATVLARASEPLLAADVHDELSRRFPSSGKIPTLAEVRTILAAEPEFMQPVRYRWQLGGVGRALSDAKFATLRRSES
jgi:hypothetical protein